MGDWLNDAREQHESRVNPFVELKECDCCLTRKDLEESEYYPKRGVYLCWECLNENKTVRNYLKNLKK
tara:strand:+ start:138 stop:341 length:204 start_codon:yes stop_codon:yes gene_type:complete